MDNMEIDLRRCVEHIKHVHRELEQLEKEVGSVLDKYEKAKAFNSMQQRRDWKRATQPAPATPVPKQPVAAVPVQPIPVSTPSTPASVQKEVPVTAENVMQEIVNTPVVEVKEPVVEVKEPVQEVKESVQEVKEVQVASVPRPENKEKTVKKPVKKFDFERTIGKVLMGIFASVLVFVSLLVFAIWAVPKFGDTTKMILMYAVSIIIAATGLLLLIKDKNNKWFLSLAACGMGALYISFLVTRMHFGVISDLTLYILFFIWGIAVCLLSRLRSVLFLVIGQIGMFVSTVLGAFYALQSSDGEILIGIVIYFVIAEAIFLASHYQKEFSKNAINLVSLLCSIIPLVIVCAIKPETNEMLGVCSAVIMLFVLAVLMILFTVAFKHEKLIDGIGWLVANCIFVLLGLLAAHVHFSGISHFVVIVLVLFIAGTELIRQLKYKEKFDVSVCMDSFIAILLSVVLVEWLCCKNLRVYTGIAPIAITTLIYGYLGGRRLFKTIGYILAALCVVVPMNAYCYVVQGLVVAITLTVLQIVKKEQYSTLLKLVAYPIFLVFLLIGLTTIWEYKLNLDFKSIFFVIALALVTFVNIVSSKLKALYSNLSTGEEEKAFRYETGVIHLILIVAALLEIVYIEEAIPHGIAVFIGFILFAVNTYEIIKLAGATWGTLITCAKTVFLFFVILFSFEQTDTLLSVVVLVLALVFLIIGFVMEFWKDFNMKPTRIMGLVLTIMSTLKLLLVDIYVENKLLLAVNLFVSGLICFAISFLYNILDKKLSKK